jgi:radical SAM-linked protein
VDVKTADVGQSFIEAALARGDRRLARVVRRAWELGAKFDGWGEHFNLDAWLRAFADCGLDAEWYANRERGEQEIFPFEHIDADLGRRFLWADQRRARMGRRVEKCDTGSCAGCDVCNDVFDHTLAQDVEPAAEAEAIEETALDDGKTATCEETVARPAHGVAPHPMPPPVQRIRLAYSRGGGLAYLSHLDFMKVMFLVLRRARVPLAYSQGYNPQPRVQFAPPMSLGMTGEHELLDLLLSAWTDPRRLLDDLRAIELAGLALLDAEEIPVGAVSLESQIRASRFRLEWAADIDMRTAERFRDSAQNFERAESCPIEVRKKDKTHRVDLRQSVPALEMEIAGVRPVFRMTINQQPGAFVKPHEALAAILGQPVRLGIDIRAARVGFVMDSVESLITGNRDTRE